MHLAGTVPDGGAHLVRRPSAATALADTYEPAVERAEDVQEPPGHVSILGRRRQQRFALANIPSRPHAAAKRQRRPQLLVGLRAATLRHELLCGAQPEERFVRND